MLKNRFATVFIIIFFLPLISSSGILSVSTTDVSPLMDDNMRYDISEDEVHYYYDHLVPMRDISIPEIDADRVWSMMDMSGLNITGEGILIADIDTGVDWLHPDLWFADGESYNWIDDNTNGYVDTGDGIDIDRSGDLQSDESLGIIDVNGDGVFQTELDWIWVESVSNDGIPQLGERFLIANDTDDNNVLDIDEQLIMLTTPKTKYIVETDGGNPASIVVWERGVNLTATTHTDYYGHGTAVSSILLGGHPKLRKYTGVAPGAELMMLNVYGSTGLDMLDALNEAERLGADVIITEVGQWVEVFMDGSDPVEQKITELVGKGIPVISPAGNLGNSRKHMVVDVIKNMDRNVDFDLQAFDSTSLWMTLLSVNDTAFRDGIFEISVPNGGTVTLHPGTGYRNWGYDNDVSTNTDFASYIDVSSRNTQMMQIEMRNSAGLEPNFPYTIHITLVDNATVHGYVYDESSGWSGGSEWPNDYSHNYTIAWPATADDSISVASYHTRSYYGTIGAIAEYSGRGPRIDGVLKQGVAAPGGYDIISDYTNQSSWSSWYAGPGGVLGLVETYAGYRLFSGTSAAGPHVAGCAALMIQANSFCNMTVGDIIKATAREDTFTNSTPNSIWGYGKLNVSAAVLAALELRPAVIHTVWRDLQTVEYDDTVHIITNVSQGTYPISVYLRTGVDDPSIPNYHLMTIDANGNYTYTLSGFTYGTTIYYKVEVNETAGSLVSSPTRSFLVFDLSPPELSGLSVSPQPAGIGDIVTVRIQAKEDVGSSGLAGVYFNYTLDSWVSWTTITMTYSGGYYSGTIPGQPYGKTVGYVIYARDNAENSVNTGILYYDIEDDHAPVIGVPVHSPTYPNSTQKVEVSVTVTDESSISSVILGYFNGSHWNNVSMMYNGTCYTASIQALTNDTHVLYMVYAYDEHGNGAAGSLYSYTVHDKPENTTTTATITNSTTAITTTSSMNSLPTNTTLSPDPVMIYITVGVCILLAVMILIVVVHIRKGQ